MSRGSSIPPSPRGSPRDPHCPRAARSFLRGEVYDGDSGLALQLDDPCLAGQNFPGFQQVSNLTDLSAHPRMGQSGGSAHLGRRPGLGRAEASANLASVLSGHRSGSNHDQSVLTQGPCFSSYSGPPHGTWQSGAPHLAGRSYTPGGEVFGPAIQTLSLGKIAGPEATARTQK